MKDAVHHLRHIQRKVIQETRKQNAEQILNNNHSSLSPKINGKKVDYNPKTPRV